MFRTTASLLCILAFAGCTDGTEGGSIGSGGNLDQIPDALKMNVEGVSYNANSDTLVLRLNGVDGGPQDLTYRRNAALDVAHYHAFTYQDDPLDRHFTALVAQSTDGSVMAGAVADGGQFERYFGGGFFQRRGSFDAPPEASGQVSYAGAYAGLIAAPGAGGNLLPVPAGTDPAIVPGQASRVEGDIFINVNFGDNIVNGSVYNRRMVEDSTTLPDVVLLPTGISSDGIFTGDVSIGSGGVVNSSSSYGGIFGGPNASAVAGTLSLDNPDGLTPGGEIGVFVLTQCGQAGDDPICDTLN